MPGIEAKRWGVVPGIWLKARVKTWEMLPDGFKCCSWPIGGEKDLIQGEVFSVNPSCTELNRNESCPRCGAEWPDWTDILAKDKQGTFMVAIPFLDIDEGVIP